MPLNSYFLPTKIYFGSGVCQKLPQIIGERAQRIFFVVDDFFLNNDTFEGLQELLKDRVLEVASDIKANPTVEQVERVRGLITKFRPEVVVALGGGSVLDTAKAASILASNQGTLADFLEKKRGLSPREVFFIAIPTTSGTGSEVSPFATVWCGKKKYSLSSAFNFPSVAVCDPRLTLTMPALLTASTGIDALCQAIEAHWSVFSTPLSDSHAQKSISLAVNYLERAVKQPDNLFFREQMMLSALEAGRAFSQTKTTAVHSVSYPLTAYFNLPHGYACGLTLGAFLKYNWLVSENDCNDKRGVKFVKKRLLEIAKTMGCSTIDEACSKIEGLMLNIGLETSLSKAGVNNIELIVEHGFTRERVANNPRLVSAPSLRQLLETIL